MSLKIWMMMTRTLTTVQKEHPAEILSLIPTLKMTQQTVKMNPKMQMSLKTQKKILTEMKKLSNSMPSALIIVAAGNSTRMGGIKKEYLPLYNGTVLSESARVFFKTYQFSALAIAHPKNGKEKAEAALFADTEMHSLLQNTNLFFVEGGKTRQESVLNALKAIAPDMEKNSLVLIHDGARPFVTSKIILDTIAAAQKYG